MRTSASDRGIGKANENKNFRDNQSRSSQVLEANLSQIFGSLAELLLASGFGYARVGKLLKISFVNAAASISGEKGERVSKARIAALTGLTRTEVSQLLRVGRKSPANAADPANRALRVVQGWLNDARYVGPYDSPRRLPFRAGKFSFTHLVKKYSGDIPARAMLSEMKRLRIVRHDSQDHVHLVRASLEVSRRTMLAMRAISPWIEMLATSSSSNRMGELTSKTKQVNLAFSSLPQLLAAVRELEHRRVAFLNGLEQLGNAALPSRKHTLKISIAVAAEKAVLRKKSRKESGANE